jgi:hypothetical protein
MSTKFDEFEPLKLAQEEVGSETNAIIAALSGVASGSN